jgi:hypothetical protein
VLPCRLPEYQAVSALPVPGGLVNLAGGNLIVDASITPSTRLDDRGAPRQRRRSLDLGFSLFTTAPSS